MNTKVYTGSENYCGIVVKLAAITPIEGADRIVKTSIFGSDVIIGKEHNVGDIGVWFPAEVQLSYDFIKQNNLYRKKELNADQTKTGYLEENGRVKSLKLKFGISTALWMPISSLDFVLKGETIDIGTGFNVINGVEICKKYVRKYNKAKGPATTPKLVDKVDRRVFPEHVDTSHLAREIEDLSLDDVISVTVKLHGTSAIYGNVPVKRQFAWYERLLAKLGVKIEKERLGFVSASRRVIKSIDLNELAGKQHFYASDIWTLAGSNLYGQVMPYEIVFGEIVGYNAATPIQKGYTYGLPSGAHKLYVYRIARTNPSGYLQDLPWWAVKQRATELGLAHVPEVFFGKVEHWLKELVPDYKNETWREQLIQAIKDKYLDKPSQFNGNGWSGVEEGIVVTKYKLGISKFYKSKSPLFLVHESKALDDETAVDLEEQES